VAAQEYQQTSTVKNQVNLKKGSLQLVPLEGRQHEFGLKFTFDATAPCRCGRAGAVRLPLACARAVALAAVEGCRDFHTDRALTARAPQQLP